jgi:hypothetical protein
MERELTKVFKDTFILPDKVIHANETFYISLNETDIQLYGYVTTALVKQQNGNPISFYILNGNHSKEYNEILKKGGNFSECMDYFKKNKTQISKFSDKIL